MQESDGGLQAIEYINARNLLSEKQDIGKICTR